MESENLWVIQKNSSELFHFDKQIKEPVNVGNLKRILKSGFNKTYTDTQWLEEFHCPYASVRGHLKKILKQVKNGFIVSHAQIPDGYGRASFKNHLSLSQLPNEIRQALSVDTTIDYDIENAQPQLLYQICQKSNIPKREYKHL